MRRNRDPTARVLAALGEAGTLDYERIRFHTGLGGLEVVRALESLEQDGQVLMKRAGDQVLWQLDRADLDKRFSQRVRTEADATVTTRR